MPFTYTSLQASATPIALALTLGCLSGRAADITESPAAILSVVDDAQPGYTRFYSGRRTPIQLLSENIEIRETAPGAMATGGEITLTLDNDARFAANSTLLIRDSRNHPSLLGNREISFTEATHTLSATISSSSPNLPRASVLGSPILLDLSRTPTAGDIHLLASGSAGLNSKVKIAEVIHATSTSAGEPFRSSRDATEALLPDITITESRAGALETGYLMVLSRKEDYYIYSTQDMSSYDIDLDKATVQIFSKDGDDISLPVLQGNRLIKVVPTQNTQGVAIHLTPPVATGYGPIRIVIKGLRLNIKRSSIFSTISGQQEKIKPRRAGNFNFYYPFNIEVSGAQSLTPDLDVEITGSATNEVGSNQGVKMTRSTITAGIFSSCSTPICYDFLLPFIETSGPLEARTVKATITPHREDIGLRGSVFAAALVPDGEGGSKIFHLSLELGWLPFTDCASAKAYTMGELATTVIDFVKTPTDLRGLQDIKFYYGYGTGGELAPLGTACNNMLGNEQDSNHPGSGNYRQINLLQ